MSGPFGTPRLTYFTGRGRAELIRLLFSAGDIKFEDIRLPVDEKFNHPEFDKIKDSLPFGQLPMLEWGDLRITQSFAIARYVARKIGLAGNNAEENAKIDMICDHVSDYFDSFDPVFELEDETAMKAAVAQNLLDKKIPEFLSTSEALLKMAGGQCFVANRLTWADIAVAQHVHALTDAADPMFTRWFDKLTKEGHEGRTKLIDDYPLLKAHNNRVMNLSNIKKWLDARPSNKEEIY